MGQGVVIVYSSFQAILRQLRIIFMEKLLLLIHRDVIKSVAKEGLYMTMTLHDKTWHISSYSALSAFMFHLRSAAKHDRTD